LTSSRTQLALFCRGSCLTVALCVALIPRDRIVVTEVATAVVGAMFVGAVSTTVSHLLPHPSPVVPGVEALVVALLTAWAHPGSMLVLSPYLVVLAGLAGLSGRLADVLAAFAGQVVGLLVAPLGWLTAADAGDLAVDAAPWVLAALAGGLLSLRARTLGPVGPSDDPEAHYESAYALLTQLRSVARRLSAGLDSDAIAAQLMETVHDELDDRYGAVFVKTGSSMLIPVGFRGTGASQILGPTDPIVLHCWSEMRVVQGVVPSGDREGRHRTAMPLRVGARMVGVVCSSSAEPADATAVQALMTDVDAHSLKLDTALVFDEIRMLATADERQRLAREIHDGIAQEVASLGYLVDDLAASTTDQAIIAGLRDLRGDLSRVVADLRLSIFDLRSDVSPTNGLGAALSDYVRTVGARSELTVHLTLDEAPTRLTPVVEAELLRIAQEAVTNARKHASADHLWVDFWSDPPRARLVVRDDGRGMGGARDDSFGISIMRERARRIDATLDIDTQRSGEHPRGTTVQVTVTAKNLPPHEGVPIP
jgi:signal transduction histidine kinase